VCACCVAPSFFFFAPAGLDPAPFPPATAPSPAPPAAYLLRPPLFPKWKWTTVCATKRRQEQVEIGLMGTSEPSQKKERKKTAAIHISQVGRPSLFVVSSLLC
jgi:hypothetical protein